MKSVSILRGEWFVLLLFLSFCFAAHSLGASQGPDPDELFDLTLAELMSYRVDTGTITGTSAFTVPVARTVITADDIAVTPARNILDLLEVYVPGATFVIHPQGFRFGFRGIIGDQNFHYLLLVNGRNMNLKVEDGPFAEIFNRDLNDIEKIEIIRGPGSVTYGSGAIGGVINIITHTAESSEGLKMGAEANHRYRYRNAYLSYGKELSDLSYYLYGSFNQSDGDDDAGWYYVDREHGYGYGYMAPDWGNLGTGSPVSNYYSDALGKPQIKLHFDADYKNWSLWLRYTSGSQYNYQEISHYKDGDDYESQDWQTFAVELKNDHSFNGKWHLETKLGGDSFSYRQIASWQGTDRKQEDLLQYYNNYSENEISLESLLTYEHSDKHRFAAGFKYAYEFWRAPWGEDDSEFLMDMRNPVRFATYTEASGFYRRYGSGVATVVDDLSVDMFSIVAEANMDFHKYAQLLVSARADKHSLSDMVYSPRIALISNVSENSVLKAVWQRSVRIPNFPELYTADYLNNSAPEPETIENYELMLGYTRGNISWDANLYYNILEEVNWTGNQTSEVTGELKMWGVEIGAKVKEDNWTVGANYSYIKQDNWKWLDDSVRPANIISDDAGGSITIDGYAENRLNNLPDHALKMYWNHHWSERFTTHFNGNLLWGKGQKELLKEFLAAHDEYGTDETRAEMNAIYNDMMDHGYGEPSFTLNASGSWKLSMAGLDATVTFYAMNIISVDNIRYRIQYYESLSPNTEYSRQSSFVDEPVAVGIKLDIEF